MRSLIASSCNTGGTGGKQGGYYYDWCANVTINPNPDDACSGAGKMNSAGTPSKAFAPDVQFHSEYFTDEEHEEGKAKALARESNRARVVLQARANLLPDDQLQSATTTPIGLERLKRSNVLASAHNVTMDDTPNSLEKRGAILKCFDGHEYGECWYLTRDQVEEAIDWFCFVNQGYEIDFTDDLTEARNLGIEGD